LADGGKKSACGIKKEEKKLVNFSGLLPQAAEGASIHIAGTPKTVNSFFDNFFFYSSSRRSSDGTVTGL
jgi:hypothetical protein